jgi:hypothetical protein
MVTCASETLKTPSFNQPAAQPPLLFDIVTRVLKSENRFLAYKSIKSKSISSNFVFL